MSDRPLRKRIVTLESMLARAIAKRHEIDDLFADVELWNRVHDERDPIDADPDGSMAMCAKFLDALIAGIRKTQAEFPNAK